MRAPARLAFACACLIASVPGAQAEDSAPVLDPPLRDLGAARGVMMGAALQARLLQADAEYARVAAEQYGGVTPEYELMWSILHPARDRYDFTLADAVVDFAIQHQMVVRGHPLVWYLFNPSWLEDGDFTREELIAILRDHILTVVGHFRGRISEWNVVNEAVDEVTGEVRRDKVWGGQFGGGIGPEYIDMAFRWAHEADPDAKLFYNDALFEHGGQKADGIYRLVSGLRDRGVPIDGVGFQMHLPATIWYAPWVTSQIARFNALGLEVAVTEMDVWLLPPYYDPVQLERQAQVYGEALRACLQAASCDTFITWGYTDRYSWIPSFFPPFGGALPFDQNLLPKPAARALQRELRS